VSEDEGAYLRVAGGSQQPCNPFWGFERRGSPLSLSSFGSYPERVHVCALGEPPAVELGAQRASAGQLCGMEIHKL